MPKKSVPDANWERFITLSDSRRSYSKPASFLQPMYIVGSNTLSRGTSQHSTIHRNCAETCQEVSYDGPSESILVNGTSTHESAKESGMQVNPSPPIDQPLNSH
ncbi:uncharacterized protein LOC119595092 [Penaeus monodon]|uniref:uncharacterized protein LOC119595092 n=1 Tax=Penaeus monodon TaxID=6687 RepID=UPI0018A71EDD|nr:uncharacterized protein LOC119595092 [Penaeus monodon]